MKENINHPITVVSLFILMILCVPSLLAQEFQSYESKNESKNKHQTERAPFDTITWNTVHKENEKENPFVQFWGYLFREREIDSVTDEDLTVVETATFSEDEYESPAPVGVVAVQSLQQESK